jgi:hypothetical protein
MANPSSTIMNEYLSKAKQTGVANATAQKKQTMAAQASVNDDALYRIASAQSNGTGNSMEGYERDLRTMGTFDLIGKYGSGIVGDLSRLENARERYRGDESSQRGFGDVVGDAAIGVPTAFASGIHSIANLIEAPFAPETAARDALANAKFGEWANSFQSDALNQRRRAAGADLQNTQADNKAAQERGEINSLERMGRDAYDAAARYLDDGALTSDVVAQGVGSLFIGGPMIKGFSKVGQGILKAAGRGESVLAGRVVNAAAGSLGVGTQEAGGAYDQTVQAAMERMADRTDLTEEQKLELANKAGLEAAAIQGTVAAGIGLIPGMTNLERAPLALRGSVRNSVKAILGETLEEATQSTSGQLAQNRAIRDVVDPNQDMLEGVGEQTALGAIGGFGSAGMVQAPSLAANTAMAPVRAIMAKGAEINSRREAAQVQEFSNNVETVRAAGPVNMDAVNTAIDNSDLDPEIKNTARAQIDGMMQRASYTPEQTRNYSPELQSYLEDSIDKFDALDTAMAIVEDSDFTNAQRLEAGAYIAQTVLQNNSQIKADLDEAIAAIHEDDPEFDKLIEYNDLMDKMGSHPIVQRMVQQFREQVAAVTPEQVNAEAMATPEGKQTASAVATAVASDPEAVSPEVISTILEHDESDPEFSPVNRKILEGAQAYHDMKETLRKNAEQIAIQNINAVTDNMIKSRFEDNPQEGSPLALSLRDHYTRFYNALMANDDVSAKDYLDNLGFFAAHMQNKLATVNSAIEDNAYSEKLAKPYMAVVPARTAAQRKWVPSNLKIWMNGRAKDSVRLAKRIQLEAQAITNTYNNLVEQNPEFNLPTIDVGTLNPLFDGSIDEVVNRYKGQKNVQTSTSDSSGNANPQRTQQSEGTSVTQSSREGTEESGSETSGTESRGSRVTPEQARGISDRALQSRITSLESMIEDNKATVQDRATLAVLRKENANRNAEAMQREREEQEAEAKARATESNQDQKPKTPEVTDSSEDNSEESTDASEESNVDEEVEEPNAPTLQSVYTDLHEGSNFLTMFKAKFKKSRIATNTSPQAFVGDALFDKESLKKVSGTNANGYTKKVAQAYHNLFRSMGVVQDALNRQLAAAMKQNPNMFKRDDRFNLVQGKVLNFVGPDGKWNPQIIEKAIMAAMQFVITGNSVHYNKDKEDIAKAFGMDPSNVTPWIEGVVNNTIMYNDAVYQLSRKIADYLGVSVDPNAPMGIANGMMDGLAIEVLRAFETAGYIESGILKTGKSQHGYLDFRGFTPGKKTKLQNEARQRIKDVSSYPNAMDDIVLTERDNPVSIGEQLDRMPKTRLRQDTPLTRDEQRAVRLIQNTPLYANTTMANLYQKLGKDNLVRLFGSPIADPAKLNREDLLSKEGKNLTVISAFDAFEKYFSMLQEYANDTKDALGNVPMYFGSEITSVGRLMMIGEQNPVAAKIIREFLLPTKATVDMNDPVNEHNYYLMMAQALGKKLDKMTPEQAVQQAKDTLFSEDMGNLLETLETLMGDGEVTVEAMNVLQDNIKSPFMLHALTDFIRYNQAKAEGNLQRFTTSLYLEADGRTNGPAGALFLYGTGAFTLNQLRDFQRVGVFPGDAAGTEAEPNFSGKQKIADLYELTADRFTKRLGSLVDDILNTARAANRKGQITDRYENQIRNMFGAVTTLIHDTGNGIVTNAKGKLETTRGSVKNPLTKFIYGAGEASISAGITQDILASFYEAVSEHLTTGSNPVAFANMQNLIGHLVHNKLGTRKSDGVSFVFDKQNTDFSFPADEAGWRNFKFTSEQVNTINANVRAMYVNPMVRSINSVMVDTLGTTGLLIAASNMQNELYAKLMDEAIKNALKEKKRADPKFQNHHFLSENELKKIKNSLNWVKPQIDENLQSLNLSPTEAGLTMDSGSELKFVSSLDGNHNVPGQVNLPGAMGVRAVPLTTINFGDARMVINAFMKGIEKVLAVYDGMHMSLDRIPVDSVKYNEAVSEAWDFNALKVFTEQFEGMVKNLSPEMLADMASDENTPESILRDLQRASREIDARQYALNQVALSVDQMAATGSSFTKNMDKTAVDEQQTFQMLNDAYDEFMAKQEPKEVSNFELPSRMKGLAVVHKESGAYVIRANKLIENIAALTTDKNLISLVQSLKLPNSEDVKIIFGSAEARRKYAPDLMAKSKSTTRGLSDPATNRILLNTQSMETLVHELIHAATFNTVYNSLNGSASEEQMDAVERIEALMDQFINMDYDTTGWSDKAKTAYRRLTNVINNALSQNENDLFVDEILNRAIAVNEFMAWTLSNQELGYVASKTQASPEIVRWTQKAWRAVQQFFRAVKFWEPRHDILSNLRFNTQILTTETEAPSVADIANGISLAHEEAESPVLRKLFSQLSTALQGRREEANGTANVESIGIGGRVANDFSAAFPMDAEQKNQFAVMVTAMSQGMGLEGNAFARIADIYQTVLEKLDVTDFLANPESTNPAEIATATAKYNAVMGNTTALTGADGVSTRIPAFLALSLIDPEFRKVLEKLKTPKNKDWKFEGVGATLNDLGSRAMQGLNNYVAPTGKATNAKEAVDNLIGHMTRDLSKAQTAAEMASRKGHGYLDKANDFFVENMERLSKIADEKLSRVMDTTQNKYVNIAAGVGKMLTGVINAEVGEANSESMMQMINRLKGWDTIRAAYSDIVGRTKTNAGVYDLIKLVKSVVSQGREKYREQLPKIIKGKFKKAPTAAQWTSLFRGIAKTDIAALRNHMTQSEMLEVIGSDANVRAEIARLEGILPDNVLKADRIAKAKQLANFMNTGVYGDMLLRNAKAVADLRGMNNQANSTVDEVQTIDSLISLYAFQSMDAAHRNTIRELMTNEPDAMKYLIAQVQGARQDELAKVTDDVAYNVYKGYTPSEQREGISLIVAEDTDRARLERLGYVRKGDYNGSNKETRASFNTKGYYYSPVTGNNPFTQGISQNVNETVGGVDPIRGFSFGVRHAGIIMDPRKVQRIANSPRTDRGNESLSPIFNKDGDIIAFERTIDPAMDALLDRSTDLADMLGAWRGRQFEEENAIVFNTELLGALKDMHDRRPANSNGDYINILDDAELARDPVLADAVKLLSPRMKAEAAELFGENNFIPVRKDMLNDVVGYRAASVGDSWTGVTRFNENTQNAIVNLATGFLGRDAFKKLVQAERFVEGVVGDIRKTIVVRSVIVPWGNFISNMGQLLTRGVPLHALISGVPKKLNEIQTYAKSQRDHIRYESDLLAAKGANDTRGIAQAEAKLKTIEDMQKRLSIWPLIAAGEFSSIAEDLDKADNPLATGRWMDWIESKIPQSGMLKEPLKYYWLASDTPLFKALQTSVNYGDFVAKAVLYDHMTKTKKISKEDALPKISEEYVNYDKVRGRVRQKLENVGLLWFWNFKLRSTKVALSMIRENPVHALFYSLVPTPDILGDIDSPLLDNIFYQATDGSLGYSIGPGMAVQGFNMNPWNSLIF